MLYYFAKENTLDMNKKIQLSNLLPFIFLMAFAMLCIIMLLFPALYASNGVVKEFYPNADNGFVWLSFNTHFFEGNDLDIVADFLKNISWIQLIIGVISCVLVLYGFLINKLKRMERLVVSLGFISMFLYTAEGIVCKRLFCEVENYSESYFSTMSFVPIIIGMILFVGYCITSMIFVRKNKTMQQNTKEDNANLSMENEKIELLLHYKKLCDDGIITQEEFDAKKKQLLNL